MKAGDDQSGETVTSTDNATDNVADNVADHFDSCNAAAVEGPRQPDESESALRQYIIDEAEATITELQWRAHLWQSLTKFVEVGTDFLTKVMAQHEANHGTARSEVIE